ncbi:MAG: monovalent cation/H+ antiporter subunit D family protein [Parvibaculaceae bacterium]|nr:monovalent cation/H+ antiporter subunit D family protein [Parvibaculaceae bacterium]
MFEQFMHHLPALQTVIPLIAAPLCMLLGSRKIAWGITVIASSAAFLISCLLLSQVIDGSVISYHLGGWAPPLGIEYRIDAFNAFVLLIVSGIGALIPFYAPTSIKEEIPQSLHSYFYTAYLLCLTGLLGVTVTGDAFNVFVFLEVSSLSTYALVAMGAKKDPRALTAAFNYLVMGTIGATFFVLGLGLLYILTGTLNMVDLADKIVLLEGNRTLHVAFAFILVGLGLKIAMFPMHLWLPNAYAYAPSAVTAFLAATATKVAVYTLLRFLFTVFSFDYAFEVQTLKWVVLPLAIMAMFASSIVAIFQTNLKRLLAYSSIAQVGYMLLGVTFLSKTGLMATIIHLFNHAVTKGGLFMAVGALVLRYGSANIDDLRGAGKQMPWTMAAFVGGGLSLIGVPLTAGFISKWYLISAAFEADYWLPAILIVASSLLAVIYVWRVVEAAYLQAPVNPDAQIKEAPPMMLASIWILVGASFYFGIDASFTTEAASAAADILLGNIESGNQLMLDTTEGTASLAPSSLNSIPHGQE